MTHPHLAKTHEQYPNGFPKRINDYLIGHWRTPDGVVVVEDHPHGYEVHFYPCYDFDNCDSCSPERGSKNPHTKDGHDFRACENRSGPILTVAGGQEGYEAVLEYLAVEGSTPHISELAKLHEKRAKEEREFRKREREEHEKQMGVQQVFAPSPEERLDALEAELAELRKSVRKVQG